MRRETSSLTFSVVASLLAASLLVPCTLRGAQAAKRKVPQEAALRARVDQFYKALRSGDHDAVRELMPPQLRRCDPDVVEEMSDLPGPRTELLSWQVQDIRYDDSNFGEELEGCPGETFNGSAGAIVSVQETIQESGKPATTDELEFSWVYVDGTWYFLTIEC